MTAQDSSNNTQNFAYPSDGTQVHGPTTPVPNSTVVTNTDQTLDPVNPSQDDGGNMVSGPSFDTPLTTPSVANTDSDAASLPENPVTEVSSGAKNEINSTTDMPGQFVEENDDTKVSVGDVNDLSNSDQEKKENPLQALARKLAQLKSELIEENDKEGVADVKNDVSIPSDQPVVPVSDPNLINQSGTDQIVDGGSPVEQDKTDVSDLPFQDPGILQADQDGTTSDQEAVLVESGVPSVEPQADAVNQEVKQDDLPGVSLDVAQSTASQSDMSDTGPESVFPGLGSGDDSIESSSMPDVSVTESPVTEGSGMGVDQSVPVVPGSEPSQEVLDESDNTQAVDSKVEEGGGKYPLGINKLLDIAIDRNASDLLISVGYPAMIRVDGSLIAANEQIVSAENAIELIYPVLSDQKKELLEVNREVDLAYSHQHQGEARFRINAFFAREKLAAAFRLIPTKIKTIEELQLPAMYNQFANLNQGLILITGPTGHGKSTTLAAILQKINTSRPIHAITIEDPIEYVFPKAKAVFDQREMHDDTHSWTIALKSALRQDPDVILVGEMRDYETIASAITLAETGHLVFATLHTNSASQTVDRIIDVFPENQQAQVRTQLANIIEAVVAQRLIPLDGGGRRAVSEIMLGTPAVRNLIREGKTHQIDNVIRTSADIGMVSLEHALVDLVRQGLITMDRAQEYAVHPEEVVRLLKS